MFSNVTIKIYSSFLRSVSDRKALEWSYKIENTSLILTRLSDYKFDQVEILNNRLLDFLLSNSDEYNKQLTLLFKQLLNTNNYKFIGSFFNQSEEKVNFVINLNLSDSKIFYKILTESDFSGEQIKDYSVTTLCYSNKETIESLNEDNCLSKYVSELDTYLDISDPIVDKLIDSFTLINACFKSLNYEKSNMNLFKEVYSNDFYELNFDNIVQILSNLLQKRA